MSADPPDYRVIDIHAQLAPLNNDQPPLESEAMGINSHHQVVGWYVADGFGRRAFLWLPDPAYGLSAGAHDLNLILGIDDGPFEQTPEPLTSYAMNINDAGQVVGVYDFHPTSEIALFDGYTTGRAIVWDVAGSAYLDVTALVDASQSLDSVAGLATDISNDDPPIVVGWTFLLIACNQCDNEQNPADVAYAFRLSLDDIANQQPDDVEFLNPPTTVTYSLAHGVASTNAETLRIVGYSHPPLCSCGDAWPLPGCPTPEVLCSDPCITDHDGFPWHWLATTTVGLPIFEQTPPDPNRQTFAFDVNDSAHVVGRGGKFHVDTPGPPSGITGHDEHLVKCSLARALFWHAEAVSPGPSPTDPLVLSPTPDAAHEAEARAITSVDGEGFVYVVGNNLTSDQALLWRSDDPTQVQSWTAYILDDLIDPATDCATVWSVLARANDISDDTWIVGRGFKPQQIDHYAYAIAPAEPPPACKADLDDSGCVDGADLALLVGAYGICVGDPCPADLNCDGIVDGADLSVLLAMWGCGCTESSELSAGVLAAAEEGDYLPLYAWLVSDGQGPLAVQVIEATGLSQ